MDTGNPGADGRDADRIVALCKQAGVKKIDNLVITHYHSDHVGGLPQLAERIPIGRFIDHGTNRETGNGNTERVWEAYQKVLADGNHEHLVVKPGDVLPIRGMHVEIVSADGFVLTRPLTSGGAGKPNPACATTPIKPVEVTENDRSVGMLITYGKTRILDLGDLTWAKERPLMCPVDKLGQVDVYIASHHGLDRSGSAALVKAVAPRLVIIDNGATKGAVPSAWEIIDRSPRLSALWQLHKAVHNDATHNVPDERIANLPGLDAGHSLELIVRKDGSLAMTNQRTGATVQYGAPKK